MRVIEQKTEGPKAETGWLEYDRFGQLLDVCRSKTAAYLHATYAGCQSLHR